MTRVCDEQKSLHCGYVCVRKLGKTQDSTAIKVCERCLLDQCCFTDAVMREKTLARKRKEWTKDANDYIASMRQERQVRA